MRHNLIYVSAETLTASLAGKLLDKACELQQVHDAKERPSPPHDHVGIRRDDIGPLRRNRPNGRIVDPQQEPLAVAVVPCADVLESLSAERMEGVGYAHKVR
jgi:hypothetical protein